MANIESVKLPDGSEYNIKDATAAAPGQYLALRSLGTSYTADIKSDISSGTFEKVRVGDYFTINSHVYYVAHLDYWLHTGDTECTTHHAVIVPASSTLVSGKMNSSNTASGAYLGSDFKTGNNGNTALSSIVSIIESDFGSSNILTHREVFTNAISGNKASGWAWVDSYIDIMSEVMVYGHSVNESASIFETGLDKSQLELFAKRPDLITTRGDWWVRNVNDSTGFAGIRSRGHAAGGSASDIAGIRPAFAIC